MKTEDPRLLGEALVRSLETSGHRRIEDFLPHRNDPEFENLLTKLLVIEWKWLARAGRSIERRAYLKRFAQDAKLIESLWRKAFGKTGKDVVRFVAKVQDSHGATEPPSQAASESIAVSEPVTAVDPEPVPNVTPEADSRAEPESESIAVSEPVSAVDPEPVSDEAASHAEPESESLGVSEPVSVIDLEPVSDEASEAASHAEPESESLAVSEPVSVIDLEPVSDEASEAASRAEPESESIAVSEPVSVIDLEPVSDEASEAASHAEPESESVAVSEPVSVIDLEPVSDVASEAASRVEPESPTDAAFEQVVASNLAPVEAAPLSMEDEETTRVPPNPSALLDSQQDPQQASQQASQQELQQDPQQDPQYDAQTNSQEDPPTANPEAMDEEAQQALVRCGRYELGEVLGRGGYGVVYRAYDGRLQRSVAIKIIYRQYLGNASDEDYLTEARIVASLDHTHIVPVFDVDHNEQGDLYVVTKLIEGCDLAFWQRHQKPKLLTAVRWIEAIARALQHAHSKGLVHRDVKPANILIDQHERAYLTDFGIAVRDRDAQPGKSSVGTPAYMSPEQARGEGHRVDPRSDIYSLGTVLYELLCGSRPFPVKNELELLMLIGEKEVPSIRSLVPNIPKDLDRVCARALALRAADRYASAAEFADDLLKVQERLQQREQSSLDRPPEESFESRLEQAIVPKGLRSFDQHDADFFLDLLPGSRDRSGLPDSLRVWKNRIESKSPDSTFSVGVIYGPSGCGKSSLVKAGLLPRLDPAITTVYLEASSTGVEQRLRQLLEPHIAVQDPPLSLRDLLSFYRRSVRNRETKLLIVIDQFEQWLHARDDYRVEELTTALRQCDGVHVQCLLMVRDDFWLATSRFLKELEIQIESHNSSLVDLFDMDHASKVLGMLGQAYGHLPLNKSEWTDDQKLFIQSALQDLATQGKIVPVRLALFAEMFKNKVWSSQMLETMGGAKGVGTAFLNETFDARVGPMRNRRLLEPAQAILQALLPESGMELKGHSRSAHELADVANMNPESTEFSVVMQLLDHELHLITPTDGQLRESATSHAEAMPNDSDHVFYQLTHDYLVPSMREWLTSKQHGSLRGRVEVILQERTALWGVRQEPRQLPAIWEYLAILLFTKPKNWTPLQTLMIQTTSKNYGRGALAFLLGLLFADLFLVGPLTHFCNSILDPLVRAAWEQPRGPMMLNLFRLVGVLVALPYLFRVFKRSRPGAIARVSVVFGLMVAYFLAMDFEQVLDFLANRTSKNIPVMSLQIFGLVGMGWLASSWFGDLWDGLRRKAAHPVLIVPQAASRDFWGNPAYLLVLFLLACFSGWFYIDFHSLNTTLLEKSSLFVSLMMIVTWLLIIALTLSIYFLQRSMRRGIRQGVGATFEGILLVPLVVGASSFIIEYFSSIWAFSKNAMEKGEGNVVDQLAPNEELMSNPDPRHQWIALGILVTSMLIGGLIFHWVGRRQEVKYLAKQQRMTRKSVTE